jgi:UrcA family protein
MSPTISLIARHRWTTCAVAALGLAFAAPAPLAIAQPDYGQNGYDQNGYDQNDSYTVGDIVVSPPRRAERSPTTGAPIEVVSTSRVVNYRDLDLSTPWGARELRARIERAASAACDELDALYPIAADDNPDCFKTTVRRALENSPIAYDYVYNGW